MSRISEVRPVQTWNDDLRFFFQSPAMSDPKRKKHSRNKENNEDQMQDERPAFDAPRQPERIKEGKARRKKGVQGELGWLD